MNYVHILEQFGDLVGSTTGRWTSWPLILDDAEMDQAEGSRLIIRRFRLTLVIAATHGPGNSFPGGDTRSGTATLVSQAVKISCSLRSLLALRQLTAESGSCSPGRRTAGHTIGC